MLTTNNKGARSQRARLLVTLGAVLTATALSAACGDDEDDAGASGGAAGAGGSSSGGTGKGGTGIIGLGGDTGNGGDIGAGAGEGCGKTPFNSEPTPVNVLWVIDQSKSMTDNEIEAGTTRWDALVPA